MGPCPTAWGLSALVLKGRRSELRETARQPPSHPASLSGQALEAQAQPRGDYNSQQHLQQTQQPGFPPDRGQVAMLTGAPGTDRDRPRQQLTHQDRDRVPDWGPGEDGSWGVAVC